MNQIHNEGNVLQCCTAYNLPDGLLGFIPQTTPYKARTTEDPHYRVQTRKLAIMLGAGSSISRFVMRNLISAHTRASRRHLGRPRVPLGWRPRTDGCHCRT